MEWGQGQRIGRGWLWRGCGALERTVELCQTSIFPWNWWVRDPEWDGGHGRVNGPVNTANLAESLLF